MENTTSRLTPEALSCLKRGGWYVGRRVSVADYAAASDEQGLAFSPCASDFLSQFGELRLTYPHFRDPADTDSCHFCAASAIYNVSPGMVEEYQVALQASLSVIGEARSDHMTLAMDEQGVVFGGFEDTLVRFGNSGIDAINCLCGGGEAALIEYQHPDLPQATECDVLTDVARTALLDGGWTESNPEECSHAAEDRNVLATAPAKVRCFIRNFEGVKLEVPAIEDANCGGDEKNVYMFGTDVGGTFPEANLREYAEAVGNSFFVVGDCRQSGSVLLMSSDGRLFMGLKQTPDVLWLVGTSGIDGINSLVTGRNVLRVI